MSRSHPGGSRAPTWVICLACVPGILQFPGLMALVAWRGSVVLGLLVLPSAWVHVYALHVLATGSPPRGDVLFFADVFRGRFKSRQEDRLPGEGQTRHRSR
jgi:hypothetical protein